MSIIYFTCIVSLYRNKDRSLTDVSDIYIWYYYY